jgi:type IV secretion system protein VirB10
VAGTVTQVRRAGKVKGRAELYVRFDSLTLPNGVTRDFRGRLGALDGQNTETVERSEGRITGDSNKGGDASVVAQTTGIGALGGMVARSGKGVGIGAAAGATAGLVGVLFSRGPDAILERGSTLEMVLDRELRFTSEELDFSSAAPPRRALTEGGQQRGAGNSRPGIRRWPI